MSQWNDVVSKSSTAAAYAKGPGALCSIVLTAGADAASVIIHDNASAGSGTILCSVKAAAGTTVQVHDLDVTFYNGMYMTISGTSPTAFAYFRAE